MSYVEIIRNKIAKFDANKAVVQGLQDSQIRHRLMDDANRLIDDAFWNNFRGDPLGAQYCRFLSEVYLDLATRQSSPPKI
jgi:hypothetical protein